MFMNLPWPARLMNWWARLNGDLDIALLPANVASVLYAKTQGNITVLDINTLGVLYVVASDDSISSMADQGTHHLYDRKRNHP